MTSPAGTVWLSFRNAGDLPGVDEPLVHDLSAVATLGRSLFCASDETASVERLIHDPASGGYGDHRHVRLDSFFDLPEPGGEMDIEGMAVADCHLWITGSQGLKRKKLTGSADLFQALDDIRWDPNRCFVGRLPLVDRGDGVFDIAEPGARGGRPAERPACLAMDSGGRTALRKALARDPILKPYMDVPCKENGFDVEGLAVSGSHVFFGLRGPVIGGRAVIVETRLALTRSGFLRPDRLGGGERYRLHAVDLDGLGVRDLTIDGGRLLILAGPTLDHDGPQAVYGLDWPPRQPGVCEIRTPRRLVDLPATPGADKADGLARVDIGGGSRILVVYDSPAASRFDEAAGRITADLFDLADA